MAFVYSPQEVKIPGYKVMQWLNEHTEPNVTVGLLFAWTGALLERKYILGSVEDHTPTRHWILVHQEKSLQKLQERGVTYVVVGPHRFHKKAYSFLSEEQFSKQFTEPLALIDDLLLEQARLVYTADGYTIYHLP